MLLSLGADTAEVREQWRPCAKCKTRAAKVSMLPIKGIATQSFLYSSEWDTLICYVLPLASNTFTAKLLAILFSELDITALVDPSRRLGWATSTTYVRFAWRLEWKGKSEER